MNASESNEASWSEESILSQEKTRIFHQNSKISREINHWYEVIEIRVEHDESDGMKEGCQFKGMIVFNKNDQLNVS